MLEISVNKKVSENISKGYPWVFKQDISRNTEIELSELGEPCLIKNHSGKPIAVGYFNKFSKISARVLSTNPKDIVNYDLIKGKIERAYTKRKKHFNEDFFRLIYAESDGLGGVIIDVYGSYISIQINTKGAYNMLEWIKDALIELLEPKGILVNFNSGSTAEKLPQKKEIVYGKIPEIIEIKENGIKYFCNLSEGQKTGYFFDQRANRKYLAGLAKGKTMIDLYTHSGGFGLVAAKTAKKVTLVDRSELALDLAKLGAKENGFKNCDFIKADIFDYLKSDDLPKFDIVNTDPPAFIKDKKDLRAGMAGYQKLTKNCLKMTKPGGIFAISSCSYFARPEGFKEAVEEAMNSSFQRKLESSQPVSRLDTGFRRYDKMNKAFKLIHSAGADLDHPYLPILPESNYLKFLVFKL